jgi:hypothetical protein
MSTWEIGLMYAVLVEVVPIPRLYADTEGRTSVFALTNGGTAGMIWGYLIVWAGYMLVFASIAEMASMYVNEAPPSSIWAGFADRLRQGASLWRPISLGV